MCEASLRVSTEILLISLFFILPSHTFRSRSGRDELYHTFHDRLIIVLGELQSDDLSEAWSLSGGRHDVSSRPSSYFQAPTHIVTDSICPELMARCWMIYVLIVRTVRDLESDGSSPGSFRTLISALVLSIFEMSFFIV